MRKVLAGVMQGQVGDTDANGVVDVGDDEGEAQGQGGSQDESGAS